MALIERDVQCGCGGCEHQFHNPTSSTVEINPDQSGSSCPPSSDEKENAERWAWLVDGWGNMTFKEKLALFMPYLHYVNPRDNFKAEFDECFKSEITEMSYKLCRTFMDFKFDPDRYGIPNIVFVFAPIDPEQIPDTAVRSSVRTWVRKFVNPGYYESK